MVREVSDSIMYTAIRDPESCPYLFEGGTRRYTPVELVAVELGETYGRPRPGIPGRKSIVLVVTGNPDHASGT